MKVQSAKAKETLKLLLNFDDMMPQATAGQYNVAQKSVQDLWVRLGNKATFLCTF